MSSHMPKYCAVEWLDLGANARASTQLVLKHLDNQDQILRTFENIPETFSQAVEMIRIHSEDDVLRRLVDDLFKILVQEIPKLVRALQNHPSGSGSCK